MTDKAVAATCATTGLTEGKHCSVCNTVLVAQSQIPVLGHKAYTIPGKPATRTQSGLTDGSCCSVCGTVITKQQIIPARNDLPVLSLPSMTKTVENEAFADTSVCCVVFPEGCTEICSRAFADCSSLELAEIPDSVTSIAADAFDGCSKLTIVAKKGSHAINYAQSFNIPYIVLDDLNSESDYVT